MKNFLAKIQIWYCLKHQISLEWLANKLYVLRYLLYFRKSLKCRRKWPINCFSKAIRFPCWQINGTVVIAQKINFVIFLFFIINQWVWCFSNLLVMSPKLSIFFGSSNIAFFEVLPLHLYRRDQRESLIYQLPFRKIKTQTCLLWE